ncbi:MAG: glutaredoxin family protein [Pseudomonadota bacterium]
MQKRPFVAALGAVIAASLLLMLPAAPAQASCNKRVYVYTAEWCGTCRRLRNYLDLSGITYTLLDADNPRVKADMRARFRSVAVPHMLVGRHAIRGLNTEKIRQYCR